MNKRKRMKSVLWLACIFLLTGCTLKSQNSTVTMEQTDLQKEEIIFDSLDTAIVLAVERENEIIQFQNIETGKLYSLSWNGATFFYDKYNQPITNQQIKVGDVVEIAFAKSRKLLTSLTKSSTAWVFENVSNFSFQNNWKSCKIGTNTYGISEEIVVISQEEQIEPQELIEGDVVTVYGIDKTIVSIILENGHGYLRLENGDYFVDGWIEVGQEMIYPITEDMLLTVPEGKHQILVSKNGTVGIKEATIERNQETKLDVSDVQGEEKRSGNVVFTINPSKAKVYIDAKEVDTSKIITLEYGIHQMTVVAEGYQTIRQYLKVGQENASISIEMEKTEEESKNVDEEESTSVSSNTVTGSGSTNSTDSGNSNNSNNSNSESNTTTDKNTDTTVSSNNVSTSYRIKIEAPVGAEVYFNGNYMGIVPIDFKKESGNHTIILRKNGYQTRSYSVQIDDEKKDVNYSFSDLIAIE